MECVFLTDNAVHCYEIHDNTLSFSGSISDCSSRGAHLVTVSSQTEYDIVYSLMQQSKTQCIDIYLKHIFLIVLFSALIDEVHIDLTDEGHATHDYHFTNANETDTPFFHWADGQPNGVSQHCVFVDTGVNTGYNPGMHDIACSGLEYSRVCEYESESRHSSFTY